MYTSNRLDGGAGGLSTNKPTNRRSGHSLVPAYCLAQRRWPAAPHVSKRTLDMRRLWQLHACAPTGSTATCRPRSPLENGRACICARYTVGTAETYRGTHHFSSLCGTSLVGLRRHGLPRKACCTAKKQTDPILDPCRTTFTKRARAKPLTKM